MSTLTTACLRGRLSLIVCLLMVVMSARAQTSADIQTKNLATVSDITDLLGIVSLEVITKLEISKLDDAIMDGSYLLKFENNLDYNVIGAGKTVSVVPHLISEFIVTKVNEGASSSDISDLLINEFNKDSFTAKRQTASSTENQKAQTQITVGGYLVGEFEYHQEPDGKYIPLLEINQARLFFNGRVTNANNKNNLNLLVEWNPVPEEVVHHIDEIIYTGDTIALGELEGEGLIPFERLSMTIENVAGSGVNITAGQIRNPFGFWSDYSSHRNFTSTKNNYLVNGFALKKIELGIMVEREFANGLGFKTAIVHGRKGRTAPLYRADNDEKLDWVTRLGLTRKNFALGASAYLAELNFNKRAAWGVDFFAGMKNIFFSGEFAYQVNNDPKSTFEKIQDATDKLHSVSGYVQFDWTMTSKLHLYGLYDYWSYYIQDKRVHKPTYKIFHGLRYYISKNIRWTLVEYGYMAHNNFDEGHAHLSTQLEVTF